MTEEIYKGTNKMLLENKTKDFRTITLDDGSMVAVRPLRTVEVADGTKYDKAVFAEIAETKTIKGKQ